MAIKDAYPVEVKVTYCNEYNEWDEVQEHYITYASTLAEVAEEAEYLYGSGITVFWCKFIAEAATPFYVNDEIVRAIKKEIDKICES